MLYYCTVPHTDSIQFHSRRYRRRDLSTITVSSYSIQENCDSHEPGVWPAWEACDVDCGCKYKTQASVRVMGSCEKDGERMWLYGRWSPALWGWNQGRRYEIYWQTIAREYTFTMACLCIFANMLSHTKYSRKRNTLFYVQVHGNTTYIDIHYDLYVMQFRILTW